MKRLGSFIGNALVSGALLLFPAYLGLLLVFRAMRSLGGLVKPLARLVPPWFPAERVFSAMIVLSICLLAGLLIRTRLGSAAQQRIENSLLRKIPGYQLFRALLEQLSGQSKEQAWTPALAEIEAALVPAFIIEKLEDGRFTVFVPSAPTPVAGAIYILAGARVHPLNIPLTQAIKALSQWGLGCKDFIASVRLEQDASQENDRNSDWGMGDSPRQMSKQN